MHVDRLIKKLYLKPRPGYDLASCHTIIVLLQEKDIEESALDAKKRRRLGDTTCSSTLLLQEIMSMQECTCQFLPVIAERDPLHQGLIVERAKLKPRGYQLDLASRLGKTQVVTNSTPLNQQVPHCQKYKCTPTVRSVTATNACPLYPFRR